MTDGRNAVDSTAYRSTLARLLALVAGLALILVACADDPFTEEPADGDEDVAETDDVPRVVVGSANFPESVMLGHVYAMALEAQGVEVVERFNIGSREVYFPALQRGDIDLLPEYTGSLLNVITGGTELTATDELVAGLREELEPQGIAVLEPSDAENRNGLVVTRETAEEYGLETTSDLAPVADQLIAGGAPEARERPDGLPGYQRVYGIEFADFVDLDPGGPLTIAALEHGDIDVARLFTSQGIIAERGWIILEDDGGLIPSENIVPVIRQEVLTDTVEETLNAISAALTLAELTEMNRRMEVDNEDPDLVARDWLVHHGFVDA
jgi:osmoprotectant transport system substrate-binding protein